MEYIITMFVGFIIPVGTVALDKLAFLGNDRAHIICFSVGFGVFALGYLAWLVIEVLLPAVRYIAAL